MPYPIFVAAAVSAAAVAAVADPVAAAVVAAAVYAHVGCQSQRVWEGSYWNETKHI